MTRYRRRAYSLVYLIAMLPIFAAVTTTSWMLVNRSIRTQGSESRRANTDAVVRDLVRRIQTDARQAAIASTTNQLIAEPGAPATSLPQNRERQRPATPLAQDMPDSHDQNRERQRLATSTIASTSPDSASHTLTLNLPHERIVYRDLQGKITRTCSSQAAPPVVFEWLLPAGSVRFRLENIAATHQIAWITILHHVQQQVGPPRTWYESAAAPVGQGVHQ